MVNVLSIKTTKRVVSRRGIQKYRASSHYMKQTDKQSI